MKLLRISFVHQKKSNKTHKDNGKIRDAAKLVLKRSQSYCLHITYMLAQSTILRREEKSRSNTIEQQQQSQQQHQQQSTQNTHTRK